MNYSIKEIIDIAIGLEETGNAFYTKCADKFKDTAEINNVFTFLAKEELEHKKKFESLNTSEKKPEGVFTEEYYGYLKSIGGGRVFGSKIKKIDDIIDSINSPIEAIKKAFSDEKESILFYNEMKNLYEDMPETKNLLDTIIEEERKHILILVDILEKINIASS